MKKAIVLGGTHDHIRLIEILKEKGYYTVLVDYLENPPAKEFADEHIRESTLDMNAVLDLAKTIKPELVITACIDQALLTMAFVCEKLGLPCHIDYQTALELTNKAYMKLKFVSNNIPTSKFLILNDLGTIPSHELVFPLVVKPADGNGSKGITKVQDSRGVKDAMSRALSFSRFKKVVIEEFLDGVEFSVDVVIKDYEPNIVLVTRNIKMQENKSMFTIIQSLFPATHDPTILDEIKSIVKRIALAYDIRNSPLLVQFIYHDEKLYVIEFSARLGGGSKHYLIRKITDFDLLKWFINMLLAEADAVYLKVSKYAFACVNYIYTKNGMIESSVNFDRLLRDGVIDQYFMYKPLGVVVNDHIASSDRYAGYLVVADSYYDLESKILTAKSQLHLLDAKGDDLILRN